MVVVIETPYDQTQPKEKEYFEISGQLIEDNMPDAKVIRIKMENTDDLASPDQQKRLQTHKAFLDLLNEKQKIQIKEKHQFGIYIIGHSQMNLDSEGYMQTQINTGHTQEKEGPLTTYTNFNYPLDVIGSSLGQWKIQTLKTETAKELIKEGILKEGEDYTLNRNGLPVLTDTGLTKAWPRVKEKISNDKEIQNGRLYQIDYNEKKTTEETIHHTRAPLFSAIQILRKRHPELREKTALAILTSPEMQTITFPSCRYATYFSGLVKEMSGKVVTYKCKSQ